MIQRNSTMSPEPPEGDQNCLYLSHLTLTVGLQSGDEMSVQRLIETDGHDAFTVDGAGLPIGRSDQYVAYRTELNSPPTTVWSHAGQRGRAPRHHPARHRSDARATCPRRGAGAP